MPAADNHYLMRSHEVVFFCELDNKVHLAGDQYHFYKRYLSGAGGGFF